MAAAIVRGLAADGSRVTITIGGKSMHGEDGFDWGFNLEHWHPGLVIWVGIIVLIIWLLKFIYRNKE